MNKILLSLLGILSLFLASSASAQLFRPPVPAAQAQDEDNNATASFNDAVSAQGGRPDTPPPTSDEAGFNPVEPSVGASFSQGSSGTDLPPPNAPSNSPPPETPQEQATAQAVQQPQMQKQNVGPAQYQGSVSSQNLNPAANAGS